MLPIAALPAMLERAHLSVCPSLFAHFWVLGEKNVCGARQCCEMPRTQLPGHCFCQSQHDCCLFENAFDWIDLILYI